LLKLTQKIFNYLCLDLVFIKIFTQGLSLLAYAYLSHKIEHSIYAELMVGLATMDMVFALTRLGIPEKLIGDYRKNVTWSINGMKNLVSKARIAGYLAQLLFLPIILYLNSNNLLVYIIGICSYANIIIDFRILHSYILDQPRYTALRWVNSRAIVFSILVAFLAAMNIKNLNIYLIAYLISFIIIIWKYILSFFNIFALRNGWTDLIDRRMGMIVFIQFTGAIVNGVDYYLVRGLNSANDLYSLSISARLVGIMSLFSISLIPFFNNFIFSKKYINFIRDERFIFIYLLCVISIIILYVMIINPWINIGILFSGYNASLFWMITIMSIPKFFELIGGVCGHALMINDELNFLFTVSIAMLLLKIITSVILFNYYGFLGFIISTSFTLTSFYIVYTIKYFLQIKNNQ
jgi:hypothetical protein